MFDFFKKKLEGKNNECYLIKSRLLDQKVLDNDMNNYDELLKSEDVSDFFKDLIRFFFVALSNQLFKIFIK